ncbi:MAG: Mut7-C RNAse domain-containing protein [Desulfurococcaceae archaeon]
MSDEPRFIVDNMLGTVARWLRILGYDTVYDKKAEDWQVLRRAELEKRVIVTRDRALHNKAIKLGLKSILLWEDGMADRLAHVAVVTGIRLSVDFQRTRCPEDNTPLVKVDKEKVKEKVPLNVYKLHGDFWECPRCGKVYWIGSHWRMIERILSDAREKLEALKDKVAI